MQQSPHKQKQFSDDEIQSIANAYHNWRGTQWGDGDYEDRAGFCQSTSLENIKKHDSALTPGRYVGAMAVKADDTPFEERFAELRATLAEQFTRLTS